MRRRALVASTVITLALTVPFAGASRPVQAQDYPIEEINWAIANVNETMFIPHAWSVAVGAVMALVQEGPLAFGDDLSLQPGVCDSWDHPDPLTYVYHLRPGVTFHDGSPVTPDDIVASMTYHLDPDNRSQLGAFYSTVESIEATGDDEVTVKLSSPNVQFQYTVAHMAGFIFKKSQLEEHPEDIGSPEVLPLGTGPYKLVEFTPADRVVLEAYDGYWGPKPVAKRIVIQAIGDRQTKLLAMRNGDIDGAFDLSISDINQWTSLDGVDVITAPSLGVFMLVLDETTPPFDDIHVRKAIAYAVDREGLVQALLKGYGEAATALNPPEMWSGVMSADAAREFYATLPGYQFDLDKAKEELAQSSVPDGFSISVPAPTADPYMVNIMQSVAANLAQIGITVDVQEIDDNQWLANYFSHENLGMQIMAYFPDFADPANYPFLFFHSSNAVQDGMNGSNFKNSEVDEYLDVANEESDPAVRADALEKVFQIANEQVAVVPIFWPQSAMAINSDYQMTGYNAFWYNIPWAIRGFGPK